MRWILEARARELSYREALQHGTLRRVFAEAINHNLGGEEESPNVLREQLNDAIRDGDVGGAAALTINLRRQHAMNWEQAASAMQKVNATASPLYEEARKKEEAKIRPRPPWIPDWVPHIPLSILFSPRRWVIEARLSNMEQGQEVTSYRADVWETLANKFHQSSRRGRFNL